MARSLSECNAQRAALAWRRFQNEVERQGGAVLETTWLGAAAKHRLCCAAGHHVAISPNRLTKRGARICATCRREKVDESFKIFCDRVEELGGVVLERGETAHRVRCANGHEGRPAQSTVLKGLGICRVCARRDPEDAWRRFAEMVNQQGGVVLEPEWLGVAKRHRVRCGAGHECAPVPNRVVSSGGKICPTCSGRDSKDTWLRFQQRVEELGGVVVDAEYTGSNFPHRVRCAAGHMSEPTPSHVLRGTGICRFCAGSSHDALYVVVNENLNLVKFGVTSGDPRPRLACHRRAGYRSVVRLIKGLPEALKFEQSIIDALRDADIRPVKGREYFDLCALSLILDLVDHCVVDAA